MSRQTCFRACRMSGTTRRLLERIATMTPAERRAHDRRRRRKLAGGGHG
jgi:hypothetical protein